MEEDGHRRDWLAFARGKTAASDGVTADDLSIVAQCRLLKVARSTLYWRPAAVSEDDLRPMRRIDELWMPFYGSRRMVAALRRDGWTVNRKRVRRPMRIEATYQKPNPSRRHPEHQVYTFTGP